MNDLARMVFPGSNVYYAGPHQTLTTAGTELGDLDHDLYERSNVEKQHTIYADSASEATAAPQGKSLCTIFSTHAVCTR